MKNPDHVDSEEKTSPIQEETETVLIYDIIIEFMNSSNHDKFQHLLFDCTAILEAYRVSGEGCYWLKANVANQKELNELNELLDAILLYGNYKVNLSIGRIK